VIATAVRTVERDLVFVIAGFDLKTGKKLAEVEDLAATGSMTIGVANNTTAVITSTSGRVWAVDYVNGRIEKDIERLPVRGEPPVAGPVGSVRTASVSPSAWSASASRPMACASTICRGGRRCTLSSATPAR